MLPRERKQQRALQGTKGGRTRTQRYVRLTDGQIDMRATQSLIQFAVAWCVLFLLHNDFVTVPE
jgi:hypothetical protein